MRLLVSSCYRVEVQNAKGFDGFTGIDEEKIWHLH